MIKSKYGTFSSQIMEQSLTLGRLGKPASACLRRIVLSERRETHDLVRVRPSGFRRPTQPTGQRLTVHWSLCNLCYATPVSRLGGAERAREWPRHYEVHTDCGPGQEWSRWWRRYCAGTDAGPSCAWRLPRPSMPQWAGRCASVPFRRADRAAPAFPAARAFRAGPDGQDEPPGPGWPASPHRTTELSGRVPATAWAA